MNCRTFSTNPRLGGKSRNQGRYRLFTQPVYTVSAVHYTFVGHTTLWNWAGKQSVTGFQCPVNRTGPLQDEGKQEPVLQSVLPLWSANSR